MLQRPLTRRGFLGASLLGLSAAARLLGAAPGGGEGTTLRALAKPRGLWLGAAAAYNPLIQDANYGPVFGQEFNILTPENDMKWGPIHPGINQYNFTRADALMQHAADYGMYGHGHALVWHNQNPAWLTNGNFTRDQMIDILADHIYTVAGRYSGSLLAWDVVNEAFNDNGTLRSTIWSQRLGLDYLEWAFWLAVDADPYAVLVYNDYGAEVVNAKSNAIYNMALNMLGNGTPLHGIGFQVHTTINGFNYASFERNMQRFADLGLYVLITELDVRMQLPVTDQKLAMQAEVYRNVLSSFLRIPTALAFQTWGFTDRYSWVPGSFPGFGAALPLDADYNPKPAYYALAKVLAG